MQVQLGRNCGMRKVLSAITSMTHPVRLTKSCISASMHIIHSQCRVCTWAPGKRQVKDVVSYPPGQKSVHTIVLFLAYFTLVTLACYSPVLVIDCAELQRADSDMRLLDTLSKHTGYWPVFTFLKSMNNLIDLASVGLIGQNGVLFGAICSSGVHALILMPNSWLEHFTS